MAIAAYSGADPIITWEPWCWTDDRSPAVMQALLSGALDDYIYRWADEIREWGALAYIRFAHEFNGHWYPWTPAGGTGPDAYIRAWHRVHDIFATQRADNAKWVWAPTVCGRRGALTNWYPGDEYVDVLGVDGYNWGTALSWTAWVEPRPLFEVTLDEMRSIRPHAPILLTEVGCTEHGGCKADWIHQFTRFVTAERDVIGFVWFEHDKETDWRMVSSPEAAEAMAAGLRNAGQRR